MAARGTRRTQSRRAKVSACRSADGSSAIDEIDDADNDDNPRTEDQRVIGASCSLTAPPRKNAFGNPCAFRRRVVGSSSRRVVEVGRGVPPSRRSCTRKLTQSRRERGAAAPALGTMVSHGEHGYHGFPTDDATP